MMKKAKRNAQTAREYMNLWIATLPTYHKYDVQERLNSGQVVTHKRGVPYSEMRDYVNMVWIDSVPPVFIITTA